MTTHGLVDVGTAGKRVADAAAEAGRRAAVGLDLGGVVVRFVFKLHEPFLPVVGGNDDRGGVDLVGDFDVVELAGFAEFLHAHEGDVHEGDGAVGVALRKLRRGRPEVGLVSVLDDVGAFVEGHLGDLRHESGVAAVVGPIGVEHAELGDRGLAALFVAEILLRVEKVGGGHGEAEFAAVGVEVGRGLAELKPSRMATSSGSGAGGGAW